MGSLFDIAEIAGLLLVAYVAGWAIGYQARRLASGAAGAGPEAIPADRLAAARGEVQAADALVKAPIVVPVTAVRPPHMLAAATQIEPVKAVAVPGLDIPEEPLSRPAEEPPMPAPVSALETLKSLSTAIPLVPVEATAVEAVVEAVVTEDLVRIVDETAQAAPDEPELDLRGLEPPTVGLLPEPAADSVAAVDAPATPLAPEPPAPEPITADTEPAELAPGPAGFVETAPPLQTVPEPQAPPEPEPEPEAKPEPELTTEPEPEASPEPEPTTEPVVTMPPPMPANAPGVPWAGAIKGHRAQKFVAEPTPGLTAPAAGSGTIPPITVVEETSTPVAELEEGSTAGLDVALLASMAAELQVDQAAVADGAAEAMAPAVLEDELVLAAHETVPEEPEEPELALEPEPAVEQEAPEIIAPEPEAPEPLPPAAQPTPVRAVFDEDAAMRAIEGGWSRRASRALPDAPEMTDVSAAVSAAQVAVEQVLARNGVNAGEPETRAQAAFGKPVGLPQPRDGRRDNLKLIDGLGPLDESTLNNMGIYHFDQIAKWSEREVLWLENHAFAVGRIGRETWQEQARELLADREATRALR